MYPLTKKYIFQLIFDNIFPVFNVGKILLFIHLGFHSKQLDKLLLFCEMILIFMK